MRDKEQKRIEIADAARQLFADYGYRSVSMDQIALHANVAKGTLYLYYKDKEALFLDLSNQFLENMDGFVRQIESKNQELLEEIHEVVYSLLMYRRSQKFLYQAVKEAHEFRTAAAVRVEKMIEGRILSYLEKRIAAAEEQGKLKPLNPALLSFVVLRIYSALAFEWEETHSPLNEEQMQSLIPTSALGRVSARRGILLPRNETGRNAPGERSDSICRNLGIGLQGTALSSLWSRLCFCCRPWSVSLKHASTTIFSLTCRTGLTRWTPSMCSTRIFQTPPPACWSCGACLTKTPPS